MLRAILLIAMIFQVLGCSYACTATFATKGSVSRAVGCKCCQAKRLAQQNRHDQQTPADERDESHTACFCKSPVTTADVVQVDQDVFSSPIWMIAEIQPRLSVEYLATIASDHRPPMSDTGSGLRIAVQSLLL